MAWAVFLRIIKAKARIKSQTNPYGICRGHRGTGVLPRLFNFSVSVSFHHFYILSQTSQWSGFLTTDHEVPGSIPGSTMGIFPGRGRSPW